MTKVELEFEKGGVFTARLLEDEAPNTCKSFLDQLPADIVFRHSIVCGHAVASVKVPTNFSADRENQSNAGIFPGTLMLLVRDDTIKGGHQFYISYGPYFTSRLSRTNALVPVNVFGKIDADLPQLREACWRILMSGAETIRCHRAHDKR